MSAQSAITSTEFTLRLPESVIVRPTCDVEVTDNKLLLKYAGRQLKLAGPETLAGYAFRPLAEGRVLATANLVPAARDTLTRLACRGLLSDPDQPGAVTGSEGSAGINTIGCFTDESNRLSEQFPSDGEANRAAFLSGSHGPEWLPANFLEQYHFTKSAAFHIEPVLDQPLSSLSRAAWLQFLADEIPHYRIWRPAFSSFNWDFEAVQRQIPREPTAWLLECFRGAAAHSELAYLGVVMKVEAAPMESHYSESEYFTTLMTKYGLPEAAVRPLWWHATENVTAGHSFMPATLLSEIGPVSAEQLNEAFWFLRRHYVAIREFNDEMVATFGASTGHLPNLSCRP